jgi:MoaA/NifB/PqqE/SkfB family radical SAM enzyme
MAVGVFKTGVAGNGVALGSGVKLGVPVGLDGSVDVEDGGIPVAGSCWSVACHTSKEDIPDEQPCNRRVRRISNHNFLCIRGIITSSLKWNQKTAEETRKKADKIKPEISHVTLYSCIQRNLIRQLPDGCCQEGEPFFMVNKFNLEQFMAQGIKEKVIKIIQLSLGNPRELAFIIRYGIASRTASKNRQQAEQRGVHIPQFLIASITSQCNLHCVGCYARANDICVDGAMEDQLTADEWLNVFTEARELGIAFILLAGGEPLVRKDILLSAAKVPEILFPVFTNGTMLDEDFVEFFDKNRNLVPIISIEGGEEETDARRGSGMYRQMISTMETLQKKKILYGVSLTVTTFNVRDITSRAFLDLLHARGCTLAFYVEYVPVAEGNQEFILGVEGRQYLMGELARIRKAYADMIFYALPADELETGGCLAAGRGFFHINPHGGAEPCPFSSYSDTNVRDTSLKDALNSKLFQRIRENDIWAQEPTGGCILFERRDLVQELLDQ